MARVRHYVTKLEKIREHADGSITVRFNCSAACGMTGDETTGENMTQASARAAGIVNRHTGAVVPRAIAGAIGGAR